MLNHSLDIFYSKRRFLIKNIKLKLMKCRFCLNKFILNFSAPFNMAIVFFILMIIFLWKFWPENYGNKETKATTSFILAIHILQAGSFIPYFIRLPFFLCIRSSNSHTWVVFGFLWSITIYIRYWMDTSTAKSCKFYWS